MNKLYQNKTMGSVFQINTCEPFSLFADQLDNRMKIVVNQSDSVIPFITDGVETFLPPHSALFATYVQKLRCSTKLKNEDVVFISFNQPFYCIHTNDSEVSCGGLLFFGSDQVPLVEIPEQTGRELTHYVSELETEFDINDQNQEEMLRLMLKQLIIRFTRLGRQQLFEQNGVALETATINLIRKFNVLVEEHFREKKQVSDYADMLHKSPKTIDNIFRKHAGKTPLQIIHQRVLLEGKRLLIYSDKTLQEITWEIGLDDPSQFSRFFKKQTGLTPGTFRQEGLKPPAQS